MKSDERKQEDDMRPKYDLSKLKFVGRGIYAERYRAGVKFIVRNEGDGVEGDDNDAEESGEPEGVQYYSPG